MYIIFFKIFIKYCTYVLLFSQVKDCQCYQRGLKMIVCYILWSKIKLALKAEYQSRCVAEHSAAGLWG